MSYEHYLVEIFPKCFPTHSLGESGQWKAEVAVSLAYPFKFCPNGPLFTCQSETTYTLDRFSKDLFLTR